MGTSSNGPGSSIKIELGSKEAENYYNRKDNSINNDYCQQVNIYDDVEEEPIYDSEDEAYVNISQENKDRLQRSGDQKLTKRKLSIPHIPRSPDVSVAIIVLIMQQTVLQ